MSLPVLTKTWQYNINQSFGGFGSGTDQSNLLRLIKNALLGFGSSPWTTRYSCNSVTAGVAGDGVDRWTTDGNVVFANTGGAVRSWYVLRQPGIGGGSGAEMCLDCGVDNTNGSRIRVSFSPSAGFTGGSTTVTPTATDQFWIGGATTTISVWAPIGAINGKFHVWQSTDGQCTRIIASVASQTVSMWIIDKPTLNVPALNWPNDFTALVYSAGAGVEASTYANIFRTTARLNAKLGAVPIYGAMFPTTEIVNATEVGSQSFVNELSSNYPIMPVGMMCTTGAGIRGRHGTFQDLWCGSTGVATGSTYPNDASRQFAQFGIITMPWGGNPTPQIS